MKAAVRNPPPASVPLPLRPATTPMACDSYSERMLNLHSRKMCALEAEHKKVPEMRQKLKELCDKWLEDKTRFLALDAQLSSDDYGGGSQEMDTSELSEKDARQNSTKLRNARVEMHNKLKQDRALLQAEEKRIAAIEAREEEMNYTLRAVPYLNCIYRKHAEVKALDFAGQSSSLQRVKLVMDMKRISDEYVNEFFAEQLRRSARGIKAGGTNIVGSAASTSGVVGAVGLAHQVLPGVPISKRQQLQPGMLSEAPTKCPCGGEFVRDEAVTGYQCALCSACILDAPANDLSTASYDQIKNLNVQRQYTYRKINHFREYLRQIQGKSRAIIPEQLLVDLQKEFAKAHIALASLTPRMVRGRLKKMGRSKYYEHVEAITNKLNPAYKPVSLSVEQEEKLCFMFTQTEPPFEQVKKLVKRDRENMLSYPYLYYRLCELCGYDEEKRAAQLLKSVTLLIEQDEWFRRVCEKLQWEYLGRIVDLTIKH